MKFIIAMILNCFLFANYIGGVPGAGFDYGTNAREISLSNSLVSSYNKGFSAFINPALLSKIEKNEYGFSFFLMSLDRSIQSVSISYPLPPSAGVSLSFFRLGTDNIVQTNSHFGTQIGTLSHYKGYGMLSFGIDFGSLSAGFNLKTIFNDMDIYESENSLGFDFGLLYELNNKINLGLKINNLSSSFNWEINYLDQNYPEIYEEKIPINYALGCSYYIQNKILFTTQIDYLPIIDNLDLSEKFYNRYKVGLEFYDNKYIDFPILLRAGFNYVENDLSYTLGFGAPIKINDSMIINIDYALDPGLMGQGISHLFSFSLLNY